MQRSAAGVVTALLVAVASSAVSMACSSSQTAVTAPTSDVRCAITANSSNGSFSALGGSGTLTVSTARDCTWTVTTDASWVTISGSHDGQGGASLPFTVAPNPVPSARSGAIAIGSTRVPLNQAGAPCTYTLSRTADGIDATGGRLAFAVTTLTGCSWAAASNASWITIGSGQTGTASATVSLIVASNTGAARTGNVSVAGRVYTVSQSAAGPPAPAPSPEPTPTPPPTGQQVHIEGTAVLAGGSCPAVTFFVNFRRVVTDGSTDYARKNDCSDLQTGRRVKVDGIDTGEVVRATMITIEK
jgi:Putative binding domain, N-terminal/Viral BACON domain